MPTRKKESGCQKKRQKMERVAQPNPSPKSHKLLQVCITSYCEEYSSSTQTTRQPTQKYTIRQTKNTTSENHRLHTKTSLYISNKQKFVLLAPWSIDSTRGSPISLDSPTTDSKASRSCKSRRCLRGQRSRPPRTPPSLASPLGPAPQTPAPPTSYLPEAKSQGGRAWCQVPAPASLWGPFATERPEQP